MKKIELLSPVGDFDCLKAAVQNGADAVYLGATNFNARNSANNFNLEDLNKAIDYSHLRNVKVFLTLNTLINNIEFNDALDIAKTSYECGIDGIIVQDIGLASYLLKNIPELPVHASTQMTCNNLSGAKYLEKLGFKRIVLARELSLSEIAHIKSNISCEVEVFGHGALCISYSGQCLYSSLIGGRSGNRGKCAQGCRLPYTLIENNQNIDKGYLLSTRDLCSLELLPELVKANVDSLKIEGRLKTPEYVGTVTRIYKKYIDKIYNNENYIIEDEDKNSLLQVFNRGGFSTGHLSNSSNKNLIYKETPSNLGIYIGTVSNYNNNKGHISFTLNTQLDLGDTICFEREHSKYTISELMISNKNIKSALPNQKVTIGRMKGNIKVGDKIYKISSKNLTSISQAISSSENIKRPLEAKLDVHINTPIKLILKDTLTGLTAEKEAEQFPETAINAPTTKEKLEIQLNKLNNTPFKIENLEINLDNNLFIPHISSINELRRNCIDELSNKIINIHKRSFDCNMHCKESTSLSLNLNNKVCLLLNSLNLQYDYSNLDAVDKIYIPLKYFGLKEYFPIIEKLSNNSNLYIYMPNIIKPNFSNVILNTIGIATEKFNIKGFVVSNIGDFELLHKYKKNYEFIGNYTLNIFNSVSANFLNVDTVTLSPELDKEQIESICKNCSLPTEFIVYGNIPLMTLSYCLLGKANKCYPNCAQLCKKDNLYYLKDRMNFLFKIIIDNTQTITKIYNSKTNFINTAEIGSVANYRIDILNENIEEINIIIKNVRNKSKLECPNYTNGNLNRIV